MICIDASVLAAALADDQRAGRIARQRLREADIIAAPDAIDVEVLSVLRRHWLSGQISDERLERAIDQLVTAPVARFPSAGLISRAAALRANVTSYDAVYVALAEGLEWPLVTLDRRLSSAPGPRCSFEVLTA